MSKVETILTEEETVEIQEFLQKFEPKDIEKFSLLFSSLMLGLEGKMRRGDRIYQFTNVDSLLERGRYPTYPILQKQVYNRLIALKYPYICATNKKWADLEAEGLIGYKGGSRSEWVEVEKHQAMASEQQIFFGNRGEQQQPKRRFWQKKPKSETPEFVNE